MFTSDDLRHIPGNAVLSLPRQICYDTPSMQQNRSVSTNHITPDRLEELDEMIYDFSHSSSMYTSK
ncbi:MAG: hypothetical protein RMK91_11500 [Pseudanabaenaceae cyanobacterium SKYGB_i_bin29]|nr:hypothetical protein [Pseudanabaenaceae cyanobacterium SKYG29]MDW8422478.1 hypothetical protein [Pseudanabaenaceae cyanobacterium SKYGB_i_bin29]